MNSKFKVDDVLLCVNNIGANLTRGNKYKVLRVIRVYSDGDCYLNTSSDNGGESGGIYDSSRFINLSKIRNDTIDEILG